LAMLLRKIISTGGFHRKTPSDLAMTLLCNDSDGVIDDRQFAYKGF
jgi:hypothetical protein